MTFKIFEEVVWEKFTAVDSCSGIKKTEPIMGHHHFGDIVVFLSVFQDIS